LVLTSLIPELLKNNGWDLLLGTGWEFFLPLHRDDEHFVTGLRLMGKDNQAEFDTQLVALTKILVDSINEKKLPRDLKTLKENDKGITKLEKVLVK
jgi:hypothetical protein